jgi:hypothetical protein
MPCIIWTSVDQKCLVIIAIPEMQRLLHDVSLMLLSSFSLPIRHWIPPPLRSPFLFGHTFGTVILNNSIAINLAFTARGANGSETEDEEFQNRSRSWTQDGTSCFHSWVFLNWLKKLAYFSYNIFWMMM